MRKRLGPYQEQRILSASPVELIIICYESAIGAIRDARTALAAGDIAERARCIGLAHELIAHLYGCLDFRSGDGKLAAELGRIYEYAMRRLLDANVQQTDPPLAEVLSLMSELAGSWANLPQVREAPLASRGPWQPAVECDIAEYAGHYSVAL